MKEQKAGQNDGLLFSWLFCATENSEEVPVAQKREEIIHGKYTGNVEKSSGGRAVCG